MSLQRKHEISRFSFSMCNDHLRSGLDAANTLKMSDGLPVFFISDPEPSCSVDDQFHRPGEYPSLQHLYSDFNMYVRPRPGRLAKCPYPFKYCSPQSYLWTASLFESRLRQSRMRSRF